MGEPHFLQYKLSNRQMVVMVISILLTIIPGMFPEATRSIKQQMQEATWTIVVTLADTQIMEIHFSDAHHGWACGVKGTVLVFNN